MTEVSFLRCMTPTFQSTYDRLAVTIESRVGAASDQVDHIPIYRTDRQRSVLDRQILRAKVDERLRRRFQAAARNGILDSQIHVKTEAENRFRSWNWRPNRIQGSVADFDFMMAPILNGFRVRP
jgi:hypothetical protein